MIKRRRLLELGAAAGGAALLGGCAAHSLEPIPPATVSASDLDEDPIALLPGRALLFVSFDLRGLFSTALGNDVAAMIQEMVPVGPEANFAPTRDIGKVIGGVYAMQGVDFCGVVQGRFDPAALQRSADARVATPSNAPLVKTVYGNNAIYTSKGFGFSVLSTKTMLVGNEVGVRRALDRIRYNKVRVEIPTWMTAVAETQNAGFAIVGDFGAESALAAARRAAGRKARGKGSVAAPVLNGSSSKFTFLADLKAVRIVGNFNPPGLNFAGALTYTTPQNAQSGAEGMRNAAQLAQWASVFTGGSLPPIQVAVNGNDVGFVQPIDANMARSILQLAKSFG